MGSLWNPFWYEMGVAITQSSGNWLSYLNFYWIARGQSLNSRRNSPNECKSVHYSTLSRAIPCHTINSPKIIDQTDGNYANTTNT
jgi:hypothetical protein